jgi:hypothetical protein
VIEKRTGGVEDIDGDGGESSEVGEGGWVENVVGWYVKRAIGCSRGFARVHVVEDETACERFEVWGVSDGSCCWAGSSRQEDWKGGKEACKEGRFGSRRHPNLTRVGILITNRLWSRIESGMHRA